MLLITSSARADFPAAVGTCTTGTLSTSFAAAPSAGTVSGAADFDCFTMPDVSAADQIEIRLQSPSFNARWSVIDAGGQIVCDSSWWWLQTCMPSGVGGWRLLVYGASDDTFSYSLAAHRLTNPQGCTSLGDPAVWSFTGDRLNGSVDGTLGANCYTFTRGAAEEDGSYWFRALRTSGTLSPRVRIAGPDGAIECAPPSADIDRCTLQASGQFAVIVDDEPGSGTGSFFLTPRRMTSPTGCSSLPSVAFGDLPVTSGISTGGAIDCYAIPDVAPGDVVEIRQTGAAHWAVVDGTGSIVCRDWLGSVCQLSGAGGWHLLLYATDADTPAYSVAVRRVTNPQGCASLGDPAVWSFTAPRVNGAIDAALGAECYTFSRSFGEDDGAYWFRALRASGTLSPRWRVLGPSGAQECAGFAGDYSACDLLASGQFTLIVDDGGGGGTTGSFFITAKRATAPAGCTDLPSTGFDAAPVSGSVSNGGEIDCYALTDIAQGDQVDVRMTGSGRWTIVDGAGASVCGTFNNASTCDLSGQPGWHLLVYDDDVATFTYSLIVRRLTNPQGCSSLGDPAVWSFTAPRVNGTIAGALGARCYTFSRSFDEDDGSYWFRALRASGTLSPRWRVLGPSGAQECFGTTADYERCPLLASGQFTLVVEDQGGSGTGSFFVTAKRTTSPTGCTALPSAAFGIASVRGNLSTGGEIDCYTLLASQGDSLTFEGGGSADRLAIVAANGENLCTGFPSTGCVIPDTQTIAILAYSAEATGSGSYQFKATCENVPCGQSQTAIVDTAPSRLGPSKYTTLLLRGHDLQLLSSVKLLRDGQVRTGEVQEPSADGRSVAVRFNLEGAALGSWDLEGDFIDGTTRQLAGAVTAEPLRPASVSVELIGRDAFRAGRPAAVTLSVKNAGNVDAVGVPVLLAGIPDGSTVEPQFGLQKPSGNADAPTLTDTTFDQATDAVALDDGLAVPMVIPRLPAGGSVELQYQIRAPSTGVNYTLQASAGQCMGTPSTSGSAGLQTSRPDEAGSGADLPCAQSVAQAAIGFLPFGDCFNAGGDIGSAIARGITLPLLGVHGERVISLDDLVTFGFDVGGCTVDATGVGGVVKRVAKLFKHHAVEDLGDLHTGFDIGLACFVPQSTSELPQHVVAAYDPNEILGPVGAGAGRFISGEAPLDYRILFENIASATAPAQQIHISDQLDLARFDPATVLFHDIRFGSTVYSLPYASPEIDDTIDLRPAQNLLVHVTAGVTSGGLVHWELESIDPDTLVPPDDPLVGFLPPNDPSPAGEGSVTFTAGLKPAASGTLISNAASIVFDANDPIATPTWTNSIDREPPTANVAVDATNDPGSAQVSWSGADDAAGIWLWEIRVAKDGGPYTLWRTAEDPGTARFDGDAGTYSFRVTAHDRADNVGQSTQAAVTLTAPPAPPPHVTSDTRSPETTITAGPTSGRRTRDATPVFAFEADEPGASTQCSVDGAPYTACSAPWTLPHLRDGSHRFAVRAIDRAGNVDPTPAVRTFVVDTIAPRVRITGHPPAHMRIGRRTHVKVALRFASERGARLECRIDRRAFAPCVSPRAYTLHLGRHTFAVEAIDAAGNVSRPTTSRFRVSRR